MPRRKGIPRNPLGIDAVIFVGASPRLMHGHTCLVAHPNDEQMEMARVHETIGDLCIYLEGMGLPLRFFELSDWDFLQPALARFRSLKVAYGGAYGNECVHEFARRMGELPDSSRPSSGARRSSGTFSATPAEETLPPDADEG